jgi:hypothetical protein
LDRTTYGSNGNHYGHTQWVGRSTGSRIFIGPLGRAINARNRAAGVMMPDIITDARAAIFRAMAGGSYASAFG